MWGSAPHKPLPPLLNDPLVAAFHFEKYDLLYFFI